MRKHWDLKITKVDFPVVCDECFKSGKLFRCPCCRFASYCFVSCQKRAAKDGNHDQVCFHSKYKSLEEKEENEGAEGTEVAETETEYS